MPASRLKPGSKALKGTKRHDTSTPIKKSKASNSNSRTSRARGGKKADKSVQDQYEIAPGITKNSRQCKFSARQARTWKPLDKDTRHQLYTVIDVAVKTVGSKPSFASDDSVQHLLSQLKLRLKSKLHTVRAPKQKGKALANTRAKTLLLQEELEKMKLQTAELEQQIRQEERKIEAFEDARLLRSPTRTTLSMKIPANELDLPDMVFYNT